MCNSTITAVESVPLAVCSSLMTSVGWMVEEYSSSGLFLVELLEEEVGQMEPCQKLVGLLEEEVVEEVVEEEGEEVEG